MKVAIIGTGRMGSAFAAAFAKRTAHAVFIRGPRPDSASSLRHASSQPSPPFPSVGPRSGKGRETDGIHLRGRRQGALGGDRSCRGDRFRRR